MQKTKIALFVSTLMLPSMMAWAEEIQSETEDFTDDVLVLDEVLVKESSFSQQIGTQRLTEKDIAAMPSTNGNITDLLKNNVNVRFSSAGDNSTSGGEIKPNEVSFHGEQYYNNNFIVNGMSNNDNINPAAASSRYADTAPAGRNAYDLPAGGTQSFWINSKLVKSIEVFDSNISAEHGRFTGGVIDVILKDPDLEKHAGMVGYRVTSERLAKMHVDDNKRFEAATALNMQPKFTKQSFDLMLNQPLSDKAAIRFSYSRIASDIQYYHPTLQTYDMNRQLSGTGTFANIQRRSNENFMLNGIYLPDNGDLWRAAITYAPNKSKYYKQNVVNGAYTNVGGGFQFDLEWEKNFEKFKMKTKAGYKHSGNRIEHEEDHFYRYMAADYLDWMSQSGFAMFGGYGKNTSTTTDYLLKQKVELNEFDTGAISHHLKIGWEVKITQAENKRDNDTHSYYYKYANNVICNGAEQCIDYSQYAYNDQIFEARHKKVRDDAYAFFIEDRMNWKNLELIAGLRTDYNQFLGKLNFAHRLSASYDVFGDEKTRLFTGLNRYYANSMLTNKLRQGASDTLRVSRTLNEDGTLSEWGNAKYSYISRYDVSKLKNPYSDEIVGGIAQDIFGSLWTLKWVHRNSRKSFRSGYDVNDAGQSIRVYNNSGWSKSDSYSVEVKPKNSEHDFGMAKLKYTIGFSYQRSKRNYNYTETDDSTYEYMIYNDRLVPALGGAKPNDFANPWTVNATITTEFPKIRLTWGQSIRFVAGRKYIYTENGSGIQCNGSSTIAAYREACGDYVGQVQVYKDAYEGSHLLWDWKFSYQQPTIKGQYIQLDVDINNVLNRRAVAKSAGGNTVYKMGRNYYLGASYNW
ncbi:outer membrane receptor protein involved in Fe transport [Bibersteinia trehalosi]|uniref:TonB-dependent receptor plug domain-containing protein n=1 Tax=Bibersteinia trehalosi TaxID=47735 RepID=UPI00105072B6|nr:TonB-dependent receptor plug domain-containing protein [Bibersteinia trehalosi]TCT15278.1 outer membrane receptor protein involved in Fe transport [Bibersteinia trehalosi]